MAFVGERAGSTIVEDLPNLKIEIENDLGNRMETDDEDGSSGEKALSASSETEEGEVVDDDDRLSKLNQANSTLTLNSQIVPTGRSILKYDTKEYVELQQQQAAVKNPNGAFVTGVNVFSPEEQAKLDKRAKRFGIEASEAKVLTEKLLKKLYKSMCVKPSDENIRVEALHMRGTEQMTTQDVFDYFKDYGPASLEWINDNSCNVVWLDDISAARALLGLSVQISGQPMPTNQPDRRNSLTDSDVDMESQAVQTKDLAEESDCLSEESDSVPLNELAVELPPGRWRRGAPHPLSPCILLRFATTSDRSLPRPGYAKFGSHDFGGYVGLISESRKRRLQNALPPPLLFDDVGDEIIPKPSIEDTDNANPWGTLAKTWSQFDKVRKPRPPSPIIERILPMPSRMTPPPSPPIFTSRPKLVARTRMRREREAGQATVRRVSDPEEDSTDNEEWCSRSKMPRMRMHADDEEKKRKKRMKRPHRNRSQSPSPTRRNDLRHRIATPREDSGAEETVEPETVVVEPEEDEEVPDLRVAVAADRSPSPEDTKVGIRQTLFQTGNVKSVLRGARGHSENDDEDDSDDEKLKSTVRRHRSRSKERRKHHRKHKKDSYHHRSRRRNSDSDSNEKTVKTVKSTIRRKSPEVREKRSPESRERRSPHETRERRSPRHERRRKEESHRKYEVVRKSDNRDRRRHGDSKSGKDLRSKLGHKQSTFDSNNEFRSKSPLQIEIDNDEYYRLIESD